MQYCRKLFFTCVSVGLIAAGSAIFPIYYEAKRQLFDQLSSQALSIAASLSLQIPSSSLEEIASSPSSSTEAERLVEGILRRERTIQREHGVFIEDIVIVRPSSRPESVEVLIDAPLDSNLKIPRGKIYTERGLNGERLDLKHLFSPEGFVRDTYGTWLIGYAPIYDTQSGYMGTILVSIKSSKVIASMRILLAYGALAFLISLSIATAASSFFQKKLTQSLTYLSQRVSQIQKGNLDTPIQAQGNDEFGALASSIEAMRQGLKERELLKKHFSRYVSRHILEDILHSNYTLSLVGESRKITVLFADIRGFTTFAEEHTPEEVVSLLNEYFEEMLQVIFAYRGTLDKFLGDGIMVEFGSPLDDPEQEKNAVLCALSMQETLSKLMEKWHREGKPLISIGIGIHTGLAVVGNIGTEARMEYTAIGDTVNVAARIEKQTRHFQEPILVSEDTQKKVRDLLLWKDLGPVQLTGREKSIRLFTPEGKSSAKSRK
ncbi:MAG: adenylate/guanylate cyclase domain-containing protein [Chlamydiota bacterium]